MDPLTPLFRGLAVVRSARAVHPIGRVLTGELTLEGEGPLPTGTRPVLARLSKGAGTPGDLPDLLGLAFRVHDDSGRPVDVLCTTTLGAWGWRSLVLSPARSWQGAQLTTLMPWRAEGVPEGRYCQGRIAVEQTGDPTADPRRLDAVLPLVAQVRVTDDGPCQRGSLRLDVMADAGLDPAFDPVVNAPAGWRLAPGWLARLREAAYVGSRRGRGA
ncbi:MAG: hypothetical protein ACTHNS_02795 [Marmoricola sp.]